MPTGKTIEVEVTGVEKFLDNTEKLATDIIHILAGALYREAEALIIDAKNITPVATGVLRASGHVELPDIQGSTIVVNCGFGGAAQGYAIFVHENLEAHHNPPTQAKFLETPLNQRKKGMMERIGQNIKARLT